MNNGHVVMKLLHNDLGMIANEGACKCLDLSFFDVFFDEEWLPVARGMSGDGSGEFVA